MIDVMLRHEVEAFNMNAVSGFNLASFGASGVIKHAIHVSLKSCSIDVQRLLGIFTNPSRLGHGSIRPSSVRC